MAVAPSVAGFHVEEPLISSDDLRFLRALATDTIASATKMESAKSLGFAAVTPGGNYPAMWVRDFSMAAGCGLISPSVILNHVRLIARAQNGPTDRKLGDRALIPAHAIPDHINYDGGAVFYPGTYSAGDDQGGEPYGVLPPVDDHYEFVHLAYLAWKGHKRAGILDEIINGKTLWDRLVLALDCPNSDADTGLVCTEPRSRAVGFGFCDGIYFTGSMLFPSLLRYRALGEMIEMATGKENIKWKREQSQIARHLVKTFGHRGWLKAATGVGQQPDVWGTIYALYLNLLPKGERLTFEKTLVRAVKAGTITFRGAVRHVPTDHDFSGDSAWEKTAGEPRNRYQNGAYWHVPTGWLARVVWRVDKPLARTLVRDMLDHFRAEDFRKGAGNGAPWECMHAEQNYRQNPVYMASVTLPLEALRS